MKLKVIIEPGEDGYLVAHCPSLKSCWSQGKTREEALKKLERPAYDEETIARDFEYVATKLRISVDELQGYFNQPNKRPQDYKSQELLFSIGAAVMRTLGLEIGGKR